MYLSICLDLSPLLGRKQDAARLDSSLVDLGYFGVLGTGRDHRVLRDKGRLDWQLVLCVRMMPFYRSDGSAPGVPSAFAPQHID